MPHLHIDVETYSSIDIKVSGAYRYTQSIDFEIMIVCYSFDEEPIQTIDVASGEVLPDRFISALTDPDYLKFAHNANFERLCFRAIGIDVPIEQWRCTAVKASYCGLPLSLKGVSKALDLGDESKDKSGQTLIKLFCGPTKPTKRNGYKSRYFHSDFPEKWEAFKQYCYQDVVAEKAIHRLLSHYEIPQWERDNYTLDQKINDTGVLIDVDFAERAFNFDNQFKEEVKEQLIEITGVENPNSPAQLKQWLTDQIGIEIKSLAKDKLDGIVAKAGSEVVSKVIKLRKKLSKTSTKKYLAMLNYAGHDNRARGLFQHLGAGRTGRWAGRGVQLQNLTKDKFKQEGQLEEARELIATESYEMVAMMYDNVSDLLSQLIRPALIAPEGHVFVVADYSAIEARVLAYLAREEWRLEVFRTHGKIYEASASMMFGVPIEQIKKGSELRNKGKVSELALGYQGGENALKKMGGESMGLSPYEMKAIVKKWRKANPKVVRFWRDVEKCAKEAIHNPGEIFWSEHKELQFYYDYTMLSITLPTGRQMCYYEAEMGPGRFGQPVVRYKGLIQSTNQWDWIDTYGGKLTENIVQAFSRDVLAEAMKRLDKHGFSIPIHVHDEAGIESPIEDQQKNLELMCELMGQPMPWAPGLPLVAEGYITKFYKKD